MRDPLSFDGSSFAAGVVVAALGLLVLLESEGTIDIGLGWAAVVVTAAAGAAFLASGLAAGDEDRHD